MRSGFDRIIRCAVLRQIANAALKSLSGEFAKLYSPIGREFDPAEAELWRHSTTFVDQVFSLDCNHSHWIVLGDGNALNSQRKLFPSALKNRLPDPSEICALEFKR